MSYVNIANPSAPLRGIAGLGALPRPVERLRVRNMLPRRRGIAGLGYAISATPPYFTPDPDQYVTITPTNGSPAFQADSTESYLQKNLVGQMQNSGQYNGWTLAQWIAAITADAVQRCGFYPGSCGSSTPEQLGQKYGTLAYQIMQMKATQQQASTPVPPPVPPMPVIAPPPPRQPVQVTTPPTPQPLNNGPAVGIPFVPLSTPPPVQVNTLPGATPAPAPAAAASGVDLSFLTNPISLFGFNVPMWMLLAGAGIGVYALSSSSSGTRGGRYR
jgi:hypothetical protein